MISVCIATYNGEKYIKEQIDSILSQLCDDDEVIISDDSSIDNTIEIIENYNDPRIKIFKGNTFYNPIFNFENALKQTNGDYIFISDQDDIWLPNKVKVTMSYLKKYDCVVSNAVIVDANGNILYDSFFKKNKSRRGFLYNFLKNGYLGCCMAFNRKILKYALPFPSNIPMHDIWIGLVAEIFGKSFFLEESLVCYRRHDFNYSMASEKSKNSLVVKLEYRIILLVNIIKKIFYL